MPHAATGHPGPVPQPTPHAGPGAPRLSARGVVRRFGATTALAGVDVDVAAGESVAVMGPSGSGKSTLLHCLAGILAPDAGTVRLGGTDIGTLNERDRSLLRRRRLGFVFQFGQLLSELPAVENVALPLMLQGVGRAEATRRAAEWLGALGLAGKEGRRPGELSGGEAQRVAVARALVTGPEVVFADEPTGALDQATGADVMRALTGATAAAGASLVLVTHDEQVAAWCSRRIHVRDGHVTDGAAHVPAATTGVPTTGVPTTGVPTTGVPTTGILTTGVPTTGVPTTGTPVPGELR